MRFVSVASLLIAALSAGCAGDNQDAAGAKDLWARINAGQGFRVWRRAPGHPLREPSFTAHATSVDVFLNTAVEQTLEAPVQANEWPVGSIIVKDGYSGDELSIVAVMEKRADGWFWAEYRADGDPIYSGRPNVCVKCHDNRATFSDWVYSFEFSR